MTDKFNKKNDEFKELKPCLEYIYKNFGREVFFSGRLSAYVIDLGPSIEEYSVIRFLEKEKILNQIETIESLDINDRNLLVNDIIYKLPMHINKEVFRDTLEIIILSLGVDLDGNNNTINSETPPSEFEFDKNTGTIVKYLGISDEIIIPKEIDGEQVKIIGYSSFRDRFINKITLPDGVVCIGEYAFDNNKIEKLYLPESLKSIGGFAFSCNQISELNLPDGVESIGYFAFANNRIKKLHLPENLKSISDFAFRDNQISELSLPNGVESIGWYGFTNSKIEHLHLPESLKSIGGFAFENNQISELNLHYGVESIGEGAFKSNKLKEVYLPESIYKFGSIAFDPDVKINKITTLNVSTNNSQNVNSNLFDDDFEPLDEESKQSLNDPLNDCGYEMDEKILENNEGKQNKDTEISETTSSEFEFDKNTGTIVEYLGNSKEIIIPEKIEGVPVKIIGIFSFIGRSIDKITLPDGVVCIGEYAFCNNKIEKLYLPDSVKSIGEGAFSENQINDLKLGQNIESIGDRAFNKNKIQTLSIPDSVKSIGEGAFSENQINDLKLGQNIELIGDCAFFENKLKEVYLPESIYELGNKAFNSDVKINKITTLNVSTNNSQNVNSNMFDDDIEPLDKKSKQSLNDLLNDY